MFSLIKRTISMLLCLALIIVIVPSADTAYADPILSEKYAGNQFESDEYFGDEPDGSSFYDKITWDLGDGVTAEYDSGDLLIRSDNKGSLGDYDKKDHPWKDHEKYITCVTVFDDLKYIGNEAFSDLINLHNVYFRGDVGAFGKDIFWNTPSNMEVTLVVDEFRQDNETSMKLNDCLKGTGIGVIQFVEDDIDVDNEDFPDEIENCYGDTDIVISNDDTSDEQGYLSTEQKPNILYNNNTEEIVGIDAFTGVSSSVSYTGKKITFDIKASGLELNKDYKVRYHNNRKVGQAQIIITGKGDYSGTINAYFDIRPKGTSIKSVKASKKTLKIRWKKQSKKMSSKRITGYQIQIATNKSFSKNVKKFRIKGYKKTSYRIKNLKSGKRYYVRIRTYIKVGNSTYYSKWSKAVRKRTK